MARSESSHMSSLQAVHVSRLMVPASAQRPVHPQGLKLVTPQYRSPWTSTVIGSRLCKRRLLKTSQPRCVSSLDTKVPASWSAKGRESAPPGRQQALVARATRACLRLYKAGGSERESNPPPRPKGPGPTDLKSAVGGPAIYRVFIRKPLL